MRAILKLNGMLNSICMKKQKKEVRKVFLLCYMTTCLFAYPVFAQTTSVGSQKGLTKREALQLITLQKLEQQGVLILSIVQNKQKQTQMQLQQVALAMQPQPQGKSKKVKAPDEATLQELKKKQAGLASRNKQFQLLEREVSSLLTIIRSKKGEFVESVEKAHPDFNVKEHIAQNKDVYGDISSEQTKAEQWGTKESREQQIQELSKMTAELSSQIKEYAEQRQQQQSPNNTVASTSSRTEQIQELEKNAEKLELQIQAYREKQERGSVAVSPEREKRLQELGAMMSVLNQDIKDYAQHAQQKSNVEQIQQPTGQYSQSTAQSTTQKQQQTRPYSPPTTQYQQAASPYSQPVSTQKQQQKQQLIAQKQGTKEALYQGNVNAGYYVIFGSFMERNNAENFLYKLRQQYSNVVDMGNDNIFDMYRTGTGPYLTKEEALASRPTAKRSWVLRVETMPNSGQIAYVELFTEEE
jgi:hypothetical protein